MTGRQRLAAVAKTAVTVTLVAWLFSRVDLGALISRIAGADPVWIAAAFALGVLNVSLGAWRWRLVMQALGTSLPPRQALRLYWSSLFFNTFLPTGVVGDALRGAWASRSGPAGRAISSVVLDRVTALFALVLVATAALALPAARALPATPAIALACVAFGLPAGVMIAMPEIVPRLLTRLRRTPLGEAIASRLSPAAAVPGPAASSEAPKSPASSPVGPRLAAIALASLLHVLTIGTIACLARAAAVDVSLPVLFAVIPAVMVSSYVPVSISGIGVRDAAMVELLGQAGVPATSALALSLPFLGVTLALSLLGGLVYLASGRRTS